MHDLFIFTLCSFAAFAFHLVVLWLLALRRAQQPPYFTDKESETSSVSLWTIRTFAVISAFFALLAPYLVSEADPLLVHPGLRCFCFYYAFKLLDLAWTKSQRPPTRLEKPQTDGSPAVPAPLKTRRDLAIYVWFLLSEMRYHDFDIAVKQKGRPPNTATGTAWYQQEAWTFGVPVFLFVLAYAFPIAETKVAALLAAIQFFLQLLHTLGHPRCPHPLMHAPFSAPSMADFWAVHWHASAPYLPNLGYKPIRRLTGSRAAGVLATFSLSGVWHAWCGAPTSTVPWTFALYVWAFFVGFGLVMLLEQAIWGSKGGGLLQRVCFWAYAFGVGGQIWRWLECHNKTVWLRGSNC